VPGASKLSVKIGWASLIVKVVGTYYVVPCVNVVLCKESTDDNDNHRDANTAVWDLDFG
jgi:hypothetical protein